MLTSGAWFGMETAGCAPHGLWQIGLDEGLAQIASFGFTTIRQPFSNACLHAQTTPSARPQRATSPVSAGVLGLVRWLRRRGDAAVELGRSGWSFSFADPAVRSVVNAWGMTSQVAGGRVTCIGTDWAVDMPAGGQRVAGLQVVTSGDAHTAPRLDLR